MKKLLYRLLPPGTDEGRELSEYAAAAFVFILLWSVSFLFAYISAVQALYTYEYGKKILMEGAVIKSFDVLMAGKYAGIWGYLLICAVMAAVHYADFYNGSKSIYVMKRLKSAKQLHVRCLAVPILAAAAGVLFMLILMGISALVYLWATPKACLPAFTGFDIWRSITL